MSVSTRVCSKFIQFTIALSLTTLLLLNGCSKDDASPGPQLKLENSPIVTVVNYPLAYFARRIGGEHIRVSFPIPKNVDPAFWKPDINNINQFQQADVIFLNGADYASWTNLVSLPESKLINTSASVQETYINVEDTATHQHGPEGEHTHTGFAITTWLDFQIAKTQAQSIKNALTDLVPERARVFDQRFTELESELSVLDQTLLDASGETKQLPLIGSHPVYQYLARRYQLNLKSVHWEPDKMPSELEWKELDDLLTRHPAGTMIWEAEPLPAIREKLKEQGISVLTYAPAGNTPSGGDFMEVMTRNVAALTKVLTSGGSE